MSDISIGDAPASGAPFRIGVVLSKTFDLLTGHFGKFVLLTLVPMIPLLVLVLLALGRPPATAAFGVLGAITGLLTFFLSIVAQATTLSRRCVGSPLQLGSPFRSVSGVRCRSLASLC